MKINRFLSRMVAVGGFLTTLLGGASVKADIVANLTGVTLDGSHPYWDIDGVGDYEAVSSQVIPDFTLDLRGQSNGFGIVALPDGGLNPFLNLALGSLIDANITYFRTGWDLWPDGDTYPINGVDFSSEEPGYIGFEFNPSGTMLYGWAEIVFNASDISSTSIEITRWAYEDSGAAITVGAVPEPATSALIIAGIGILAWTKGRGRKQI